MGYPEIMSMINDYLNLGQTLGIVGKKAYCYICGCIDTLDALDQLTPDEVSELLYLLNKANQKWGDELDV